MEIVISPSKNKKKKFDAVIDGKKTISFGQHGASDYTKHKDNDRKNRYIDRHKKMKIGVFLVLKLLDSGLNTFYGRNLL